MHINISTEGPRNATESSLRTTVFNAALSKLLTTAQTVTTKGKKEKDNYWRIYIAIFGIAAALLIICTVIAIVTSRIRSLKKAKAEYNRQRQQAIQDTLKQKRDSELRNYSRSRTSTLSTEAFYIQELQHPAVFEDRVFHDHVDHDGHANRSSFVQVIPAFSQAPVTDQKLGRFLESPPPRLSPSFQSSAERYGIRQSPSRRHSIVTLHPYPRIIPRRPQDGPPPVLPREPISNSTTLPKHNKSQKTRQPSDRRRRAHSLFDNIENQGFIPEEADTTLETELRKAAQHPRTVSLPEPDYPDA